MLQGHVQLRIIGELDCEDFLFSVLVGRDRRARRSLDRRTGRKSVPPNFHQTKEPPDAVLEMDDEIAFSEFAEIDLRAVTFGASKPQKPSRMHGESSEQLCS